MDGAEGGRQRDVAGGALVKFVVEEVGPHNPTELKLQLQDEAERIQLAQLAVSMLAKKSTEPLRLQPHKLAAISFAWEKSLSFK